MDPREREPFFSGESPVGVEELRWRCRSESRFRESCSSILNNKEGVSEACSSGFSFLATGAPFLEHGSSEFE